MKWMVRSCANRQMEFLPPPTPHPPAQLDWRGSRSVNCVSHLLIKSIITSGLQTHSEPRRHPPEEGNQSHQTRPPPPSFTKRSDLRSGWGHERSGATCSRRALALLRKLPSAHVPFGKAPSVWKPGQVCQG